MTGVYLFAAAAGVPLVVWFLVSGGDEGGEGNSGDDAGIGGIMLRLFPLSTLAITAAAFGVCGLVLGAVGTASATTLLAAVVAGVVAGVLNSTVFAYLRRSDSTTTIDDQHLAGAIGRVVLPVVPEHRGRIAVSVGGQQVYLSARALPGLELPDPLEVGAPVVVVEVRNGVASVARLDAELT